MALLSLPLPPTKASIEHAAAKFQEFGVGKAGNDGVIIRSGEMGAYVLTRGGGEWFDPYWTDSEKVIDVTGRSSLPASPLVINGPCLGAGNSFLGGLAAGLALTQGNIYEGTTQLSWQAHVLNHRPLNFDSDIVRHRLRVFHYRTGKLASYSIHRRR
jgi:hypothetical protein